MPNGKAGICLPCWLCRLHVLELRFLIKKPMHSFLPLAATAPKQPCQECVDIKSYIL
jgi:hypothetical protein